MNAWAGARAHARVHLTHCRRLDKKAHRTLLLSEGHNDAWLSLRAKSAFSDEDRYEDTPHDESELHVSPGIDATFTSRIVDLVLPASCMPHARVAQWSSE